MPERISRVSLTESIHDKITTPIVKIPDSALKNGVYHLTREELGSPIELREGVTLQYETPPERKRWLIDRLLFGTDFTFLYGYFRQILRGRKSALKGQFFDPKWIELSGGILELLEGCGGKFLIEGLEHVVAPKGPVVFAGNHMSVLETFVFSYFLVPHRRVTFVVKESLIQGNFFGPIMRSRDPIAVGRANPREDLVKVLEEGATLLKKGVSIVVFPQSTRTRIFHTAEFNSIAVKLASRAGVPVVPFAIKTDFWENGRILKDLGTLRRDRKIHMKFGPAIPTGADNRGAQDTLLNFVVSNLKKWNVEVVLPEK
ncbi:1-acyl-sn-glycerol-3-phosphate acyltransferase [Leptospira wolffii]|uniref:1-acyl-sn-glycerol-3-phosphate acyltransferase n=1 Tax=Leptospira wolffii TaxID=409998 RepID=A0A2M9Z8K9_9LEPT|nr:1-acyl-sn-glycerol-3-phosphate acyltransferase [Leptospira wolffii]TGK57018.1 1-acyl-sn-glycerol-3-phosphate acyltransferase [Leptospira wolffii]TGK71051.1 1-acyl-sn-glycerol-3-phosphate acyltransferase [Leptospira wolffii]TGK75742.1 1-acyl-sn-glycerol-3-phosphate acyltransferase [Leptospira wolffii]TGL32790.1 1-acyl-sn-glycerol-3-phosphate acyltransferase [Leptospira wolffii]